MLNEDGSSDEWSITSGIQWALEQGADVIVVPLHALHEPLSFVARTVEVLDGFGVVVVCAAGNVPDTVSALGNTPLAITVGATDRRDQIAAFSGRGTVRVGNDVIVKPDLIAPGVNVPAANGEGWRSISGTSTSVGLQAAPSLCC